MNYYIVLYLLEISERYQFRTGIAGGLQVSRQTQTMAKVFCAAQQDTALSNHSPWQVFNAESWHQTAK